MFEVVLRTGQSHERDRHTIVLGAGRSRERDCSVALSDSSPTLQQLHVGTDTVNLAKQILQHIAARQFLHTEIFAERSKAEQGLVIVT